MSVRGRRLIAPVLLVALALAGCTGDGAEEQAVEELPVEVEGEVLDRREGDADDPPSEDAADDEVDPDDDEVDQAGGGTGTADDDADAPSATDGSSARAGGASEDTDRAAPAPAPAPAPPAAPPAPSRPTSPAPAPPRPSPSPSPSPSPTPTPVRTPAPRILASGPATATGPVLDSDGVNWTESSSTVLEPGDPPPLTVGLRSGPEGSERPVACQAVLEAPGDRGLVARGTLTVSLRIVATDGSVLVVPRQRLELDVTLVAGRRYELPVSPTRQVDVAEVRQVTCVAEFAR